MMKSMNLKNITLSIFLLSSVFFVGCENHTRSNATKLDINPELGGIWRDDNGCTAIFEKESQTMRLISFNNANGQKFNNIELAYTKDGVMTKLIPLDKAIPFSANYLEGVMMIDKYCKAPLSKVGK